MRLLMVGARMRRRYGAAGASVSQSAGPRPSAAPCLLVSNRQVLVREPSCVRFMTPPLCGSVLDVAAIRCAETAASQQRWAPPPASARHVQEL